MSFVLSWLLILVFNLSFIPVEKYVCNMYLGFAFLFAPLGILNKLSYHLYHAVLNVAGKTMQNTAQIISVVVFLDRSCRKVL